MRSDWRGCVVGSDGEGKSAAVESVPECEGRIPPPRSLEKRRASGELSILPPARPRRWGIRMKANVVDAVRQGHFSLSEVCDRYELSSEEYLSWQHSLERFGLAGLRQRHIQTALRQELRRAGESS